jgi:hypothetical protein
MRGAAAICLAALLVPSSAARAQSLTASQASTPSSSPEFLSGYRVRLGASRLAAGDDRFSWDARFNGDIDLLDYGLGRINFMAEYEAVLGNQLRTFDPNQSLYTLDLRVTRRFGPNELAGLIHHMSRHLSDRAKTQAVDWNALGAELTRTETVGVVQTEGVIRADWIIKHTYADYTWKVGGRLRFQRPATPGTTLLGEGSLDFTGVDSTIAGRGTQVGAYLEAGVRLAGTAGSLDLILAFERRVDADMLIRGPQSWVLVGFRLVRL